MQANDLYNLYMTKKKEKMWAGIDYGSKTAGTTVVCMGGNNGELLFHATQKGQDADKFALQWVKNMKPDWVCIDAPLSLPGVYQNTNDYNDYFYRFADKELKAMSPMFLGGLTARAMKLKNEICTSGIQVYEAYPAALVALLNLKSYYNKRDKQQISNFITELRPYIPIQVNTDSLPDWHHVDALLCWLTACRIQNKIHKIFGLEKEGLIYL